MGEQEWEAEEQERQILDRLTAELEAKHSKNYTVELHNGMYGLGLLLAERINPQTMGRMVFVTGFTNMPEGVHSNAVQCGMIATGDTLTSINGHSVRDLGLV